MPIYEFECERCGRRFRERLSPVEHCQNRPECPSCHTDDPVHDASLSEQAAQRAQ